VTEEIVDAVDVDDRVVGAVSRAALKADGSNFRVVHVLVLDGRGRILIQRLAPSKASSFALGSSVAGHVRSGESYASAAQREAREELGVQLDALRDLGTTWLDEGPRRKFIGVFLAQHEGPFTLDATEVAEASFLPVGEIRRLLREGAGTFSPTFERVFRFADGLGVL
jgi:isopentenyldiphosphate isomerase